MPRSRRSSGHVKILSGKDLDPRQLGLRSFQAGRFDAAIQTWQPLAARDTTVRSALVEAQFRRALATPDGPERIGYLRQALALAPDDPRLAYQLGMALHRTGDLAGAAAQYRGVVERAGWPAAALLLGLATLEQDAHADLATVSGSTPAVRAVLDPVQALLNQSPPTAADFNRVRELLAFGRNEFEAIERIWHGFSQINAGNGSAAEALSDNHSLPETKLTALRRAYRGVAAAQTGDVATALDWWRKAREGGSMPAAVSKNLAAALFQQVNARVEAGDMREAATSALANLDVPLADPALNELRVRALDRAAYAAATEGDWKQATMYWEGARQVIGISAGLGSPRPLLHNLALGYEAQEQWLEAAESWRAMLRTRPRRNAAASDDPNDQQWDWVRKRIIECYKRANRPDEAVTVFRQMIKAEPDDLDLRMQLSDALLANDQEQAAWNEIQRVLERDPRFLDALIRHSAFLSGRGMRPASEQVLRDAITYYPDRADLRRQLGRVLLEHGSEYIDEGNSAAALKTLKEGQELEPENYQFPLRLAQAYFNSRKPKLARAMLDRTLELAGDQAAPYVEVIQVWTIEDDIEEARAVLARAEAAPEARADLYLPVGLGIISETTPPPALAFNLFSFAPITPATQTPPADTPWSQLATELLDKAVASQPDDGRVQAAIAAGLLQPRPDLALRYAEQAVEKQPESPETLMLLGFALGMNERKRDAKQRLQQAANHARKQGNQELAQQAESMRREIDNPMFRTMIQMQGLMGDLDDLDLF